MKTIVSLWGDDESVAPARDFPLGFLPIIISHDKLLFGDRYVNFDDSHIIMDIDAYEHLSRFYKSNSTPPANIIIIITDRLLVTNDSNRTIVGTLQAAIDLVSSVDRDRILVITDSERIINEAILHPINTHIYCRYIPQGSLQPRYTNPLSFAEYIPCDNVRHDGVTVMMRNRDERAYLSLIKNIINNNEPSTNRTATPTLSTFSETLKFDLSNLRLPMITTKRVPFKTVFIELLWFISGGTTTDYLCANGVRIWDGNSSRQYLDSIGLGHYRPGELGPVYGYQWRNFGKPYGVSSDGVYVDQLSALIDGIKSDPYSRRHVLTAWNPNQLREMALPPCHLMAIFNVKPGGVLNCQLVMRSADMGLGVPFNIVSYSLLTHMIAKICNLTAGCLAITMIDCHVYVNHVEALLGQIERAPYGAPSIRFSDRINSMTDISIDDFTPRDIILCGYHHYPTITMDMVV